MTDQFNDVVSGNEVKEETQTHEAEKGKGVSNKTKPKAKVVAPAEPAVALPPVFNIVSELEGLLKAKKSLEAENAKLYALLEEVSSVNSLVAGVNAKVTRVVKG